MELDVQNIAGIRAGKAKIRPGLNVVRAQNWQGKSSFMKSLQVVMGTTGWGDEAQPLTDGASEGHVHLTTDSHTYETKLVRNGSSVRRNGEVYLTAEKDQICARLFAFLGENNPVREAVRHGGDLASLLTEPLDIENIDEQIAERKHERQAVETELERAQSAADRVTEVQRTVTQLEQEIEALEAERDEVEIADESAGETQSQEQLSDTRAKKEQITNQITTLENKIERQESRLGKRQEEMEELTIPDEPEFTADIEAKKSRIRDLETNITLLEDLYRVNKRILDEQKTELVTEVERTLTGDEIDCWLCGEPTTESSIGERLTRIEETLSEHRSEKAALENEIEEIQERRDEIQQQRRRQQDLASEINELQVSLEENRSQLAEMKDRLATVTEKLETLRADVEETNNRLTDLESEIKYKQSELAAAEEELESLQAEAARRNQLQEERDELTAEIESLRTRRNEKKRELAEQFEQTMTEIITTFEPGFESARLTPITDAEGEITDFDLVIAREGRETSLAALSEGEVELLGLVTALAGYETFDVSDRVPMILLDGLTALSKDNYHSVVEYLRGKTDCLVTTAYPEIDEFDGHTVDPYDWEVVSNQQTSAT